MSDPFARGPDFPPKLNKSSLLDACKHIEANGDAALARVLKALLGETRRAEAVQQENEELRAEVHRLANWMQGAACQLEHLEARLEKAGIPDFHANPDSFMDGVEPVGMRCETHDQWYPVGMSCSQCALRRALVLSPPDYPNEAERENRKREEPALIYLRKAESPRPFVHMLDLDGPRSEAGDRTVCTYPCYRCDPEVFTNEWAENEARRLNVRESA